WMAHATMRWTRRLRLAHSCIPRSGPHVVPDGHFKCRPLVAHPMTHSILRAQALTKVVKSGDDPLTILDGVSFDVEAGATIAIVGASVSGKTRLLGLLAGLDRPTSVEVHVDGFALSGLDEDARAAMRQRLLGFVFQSF